MSSISQPSDPTAAHVSQNQSNSSADMNKKPEVPTITSRSSSSTLPFSPATEWPLSSPYYNPLTMRNSLIRDLNANLIYTDDLLFCVRKKENTITPLEQASVGGEADRSAFMTRHENINPDVTVFFMRFIFHHRHTPDGKEGDMRFSISATHSTWAWFLSKMQIHPLFIECLYMLLGHYSTFVTYKNDGITPDILHVLVKIPPAGHLEAAFYLRYELTSKKMFVVIAGNDLEAHATNICELLAETDQTCEHPFSLILATVKRYLSFLEYQKRRLQHSVIMIERLTGRGAVTYSDGEPAETDPESFDIPNMHWIGANQRNVVYGLNFQLRLATFLQGAHRQLNSLRSGREISFMEMPVQDKYMQEALAAHFSNVAGVLEDARVTSERAQAQLNNADSIVNTMIAKQAQRTADETRKDSTSMKTIASLTMVYLPSTFAATLFSSTFFTFGGAGTLSVNKDIWKFIAVAVVLTVITIFVWAWLNKFGVPFWLKWAQSRPQQAVSRKRKIMTYTDGPGISAANAAVGDAQVGSNV